MTDWRTSETERAATTEAVVTLTVGSLFAGIGGLRHLIAGIRLTYG